MLHIGEDCFLTPEWNLVTHANAEGSITQKTHIAHARTKVIPKRTTGIITSLIQTRTAMIRTRAPSDPSGFLLGDAFYPHPDVYYYPPQKYVAIHTKRLVYLGAGEAQTLWNAIQYNKIAPQDFVFGPAIGVYAVRVYECFNYEQLAELWKNTMKQDYAGNDIVQDFLNLGKRIKAIPTIPSLLAYDPAEPPQRLADSGICAPVSSHSKQATRATSTQPAEPPKKPLEGLKTGKVWSIASSIAPKYPGYSKKQLKEAVVEECVRQGINPSTAQVQFGKWYITESQQSAK